MVAYELLTGRRCLGRFKLPTQLKRRLSRHVDNVLVKALTEDPDDRFSSVLEFSESLNRALAGLPRRRRIRTLIGSFIAVAIAVLALSYEAASRAGHGSTSIGSDPV